jgi:elongation factor Ts
VESWDLSEAVAKTAGENIQVRRFVRFNLGEGLQKKSVDFAAEVAELEADMKVE